MGERIREALKSTEREGGGRQKREGGRETREGTWDDGMEIVWRRVK